ncbi:MAG: hypothetical protein AAF299_02680 [Pseudomonadota bacterium]
MSAQTTESTVTFKHEFKLPQLSRSQPPGTYRLVVIDEEIPGLSFAAYRRAYTMLHVPALTVNTGKTQVFTVDKNDLEAALKIDGS